MLVIVPPYYVLFSSCCLFLRVSNPTESRKGSDVKLESKTVTGTVISCCFCAETSLLRKEVNDSYQAHLAGLGVVKGRSGECWRCWCCWGGRKRRPWLVSSMNPSTCLCSQMSPFNIDLLKDLSNSVGNWLSQGSLRLLKLRSRSTVILQLFAAVSPQWLVVFPRFDQRHQPTSRRRH